MKKLGEGGMGTVYLAEHVKMGRKAALKVMNPGMNQDADASARFNREAANASRLSHPNICGIYDFGETPEGLIYLAMEYIEGVSLTDLIEKAGGLTPARAAAIIHQSADALQVAHDVGIVHRDLKPDNIMITKARDGSDSAKVVDFGIAKASSSDAQKVTKTGLVVGTPEYMSPEQLAGDKLDGRSDIYSLGLVAFNCLTGKLPFPSNSAQEAMIMRLTDQPKTLAEISPEREWPEQLQAVMDKALARNADERYQSAAEFGRDMAKAVENMPDAMAAEGATQVIGAAGAVAAAAAKTALAQAVPKTRVAGAGAVTPAGGAPLVETAKRGGLPMPLIAAAAVIIIGGGAFGAYKSGMLGGGGTDTTTVGAPAGSPAGGAENQSQGAQTPPANAGGNAPVGGRSGGTTQMNTPTKSPTNPPSDAGRSGGGAAPAGGGSDPAAAFEADRKAWAEWTDPSTMSEASAQRVIRDVTGKLATLSGDNRADALYYRALGYVQQDRIETACNDFREAMRVANRTTLKDKVQPFLGSCP
ncbi:MAG: serine/threonine-protein kinase [Gemmatimonadetes bacterium]|nr:serine/threonine-protein kinase [Gemmatimonadota bacterium]